MYLIPKPQKWTTTEGIFTICYDRAIVLDTSCPAEVYEDARLLQQALCETLGFTMRIIRGSVRPGDICLKLGETLGAQAYDLCINADGIIITGGSACGLFYGMQTLRQMTQQEGCCLPYTAIQDEPQIANRGFYHDVTRGRIPTMTYLKKLVDRMAAYKLNQLQLYMEHTFLFAKFSEVWRDDTPLTPEDILELDAYCRKRHIELIPSIACFGHLYKVLRTRTYSHLCELPDMEREPFGFVDRMRHHTLDVSNPESMQLVRSLIDEFMPLFTSKHFNICADETFDLGKGKSAGLAETEGTQRMYLDFVKELCEYVVSKGKIPMFWGDIICAFPEAVQELPKETICLNWGYDADWPEDSTRKLSEAGARLYNCPGVSGWDQLVNQIGVSYENISRMCRYAFDYQAEGVLNTDWGDCGHINHPDFSLVGMIYGAAFSWNADIPSFDEINRQISCVAYGDVSESLVSVLAKISVSWKFTWRNAVDWLEQGGLQEKHADGNVDAVDVEKLPDVPLYPVGDYREAKKHLEEIKDKLYASVSHVPVEQKKQIHAYLIAVQGMILLQKLGMVLSGEQTSDDVCRAQRLTLAEELEYWLYDYKVLWRSVSRESELFRIQHVICCYADWLRS
ncbi:glycoside hydrolase family 20 zincin-like fold domain-containing protein [uncultured Eubacterium sp.]|uniref:glycoside hydrolase family 20 zincin-like fold domain-containing protein n=1 Tax=uncultured Eubacterium sp. TaxID=165185 RepID=UPI0025D4ECAB|nr:glycoside hydrolase family 20 zincin-like fold domain-containing protein [uncultured Eubacterium sp.]MCI6536853.1 family 20 glycosylhydrolase [Lachnospiraceae bacterium]